MKELTPNDIFEIVLWNCHQGYKESRTLMMSMVLKELKYARFRKSMPLAKEFLIYAFSEMEKGVAPDKALLLKGNVSGKRTLSFKALENERKVAWYIFSHTIPELVSTYKYPKKLSLEKAYDQAEQKFKISPSTAEKFFLKHRNKCEQNWESLKPAYRKSDGKTPQPKK